MTTLDKVLIGLENLNSLRPLPSIRIQQLRKTLGKFDSHFNLDCLSRHQIQSKQWLTEKVLEHLGTELGIIYLVCGWYGLLATVFEQHPGVTAKYRSFDWDPLSNEIAEDLHRELVVDNWKFKATTIDVYKLDYQNGTFETKNRINEVIQLCELPDLVVNTSCEHLPDIASWLSLLPKGQMVALQSNSDVSHEGHISCHKSLDEFRSVCSLSKELYFGSLPSNSGTRYMVIGQR